jgi:hypothetical protein
MYGTGTYSAGMGPKGPAMERFLDIKKKKKELSRGMSAFFMEFSNVGLERILCVEIKRNYKFIHFKS